MSDWVVIASGPSLTTEHVQLVKQWRCAAPGRYVCVINTTYQAAPWADVLYACDRAWWMHYGPDTKDFAGTKYCYAQAGTQFGAIQVKASHGGGMSKNEGWIKTGGNSGHQAIHLVYNLGARRIILLGFDMKRGAKSHWHGDHPHGMSNGGNFVQWAKWIAQLGKDLQKEGVSIVNITPGSALDCFDQDDPHSVLV